MDTPKKHKDLSIEDLLRAQQTHFATFYITLPNYLSPTTYPKTFKQVQSNILSIIKKINKTFALVKQAEGEK